MISKLLSLSKLQIKILWKKNCKIEQGRKYNSSIGISLKIGQNQFSKYFTLIQ